MTKSYFPLYVDLSDMPVLIIGGGKIAYRKYSAIKSYCNNVTLISKNFCDLFKGQTDNKHTRLINRPYKKGDLDKYKIVYVAVDDEKTIDKIVQHAKAFNGFINFVDDKKKSNFISPAVYSDDSFSISVSTHGKSPAASVKLRNFIRQLLPPDRITQIVRERRNKEANTSEKGLVYFVGGGSGDVKDLTGEAVEALGRSHVILCDSNMDCSKNQFPLAKWINVGKRHGHNGARQEEIQRLLVYYAKKGFIVSRLKSGDIFYFARLNEEISYLKRHGIAYKLAPGLSAIQLIGRVLKKSLTERGRLSSIYITSGHQMQNFKNTPADVSIIFMGLKNLIPITRYFLINGYSENSAVTIGSNIGRRNERLIRGRLDSIVAKVKESKPETPAIILLER